MSLALEFPSQQSAVTSKTKTSLPPGCCSDQEAVPATEVAASDSQPWLVVRFDDYCSLVKPRIILMATLAVSVGVYAASPRSFDFVRWFHTLIGVTFGAAASFILNQWLESRTDALMARTADRPLPAGRLSGTEVFLVGWLSGLIAVVYLAFFVNWASALLTGATFLSYVLVYTPLKRYTTLNTLIGAVPGALPPAIGWVSVTDSMDAGAWLLFGILFFWQFPHFYAIAWIYRRDYSKAGLKMLSVADESGVELAKQMLIANFALILVSLLPTKLGLTGQLYLLAAVALGLFYLAATVAFALGRESSEAKTVFHASLIYLPCLFLCLSFDLKNL